MRPVNPVDHLTLDEKDFFFLKRKKHKTRQDKTRQEKCTGAHQARIHLKIVIGSSRMANLRYQECTKH